MSQSETPKSEDQQAFEEWFVNNYPPSCVISDPAWHAPKIYRAATRGIVRSLAAAQEREKAAESRCAELARLLRKASGPMSYERWSTDFRAEVATAIQRVRKTYKFAALAKEAKQ